MDWPPWQRRAVMGHYAIASPNNNSIAAIRVCRTARPRHSMAHRAFATLPQQIRIYITTVRIVCNNISFFFLFGFIAVHSILCVIYFQRRRQRWRQGSSLAMYSTHIISYARKVHKFNGRAGCCRTREFERTTSSSSSSIMAFRFFI